jgi:outer membrane receptor protein involved in Fe transport
MYEQSSVSRRSNPAPLRRVRAVLRRTPLSAAVSAVLAATAIPFAALAQDATPQIEELLVTATRRTESVQDIPINISAFDGSLLERREIGDLAQLGRNVPGMYVVDQGKRTSNQIVVRGLSLDPINSSEGIGNDGGEVVSTYIGDIPLYVDLTMTDMDRVEVLLGPQGTLYGAGTLGGAIRYIPRRPELDQTSFNFRGSSYGLSESDDFGWKGGLTVNVPFGDKFAFRANLDYTDDPGFIDAPYLVNNAGVSDPEPDLTSAAAVAANLHRVNDINTEETTAGRVALRWQPTDAIDANFTYYMQDMKVGGRQQNSRLAFGTGQYESATRFLEPNERENRLAALEISADLGFASLTSATGYSTYHDLGQRDQTDLLITLEYSYELFPTFSAFTRDGEDDRTVSQEVRLVSNGTGKLSWIGGVFWYNQVQVGPSSEFTPHYDEYLGGELRPDSLEYYSFERDERTEKALFGEVGYQFTDKLKITVGARFYDYNLIIDSDAETPLLNTAFFGLPPNETGIELERASQGDNGSLFKINSSYDFTGDLLGYVTISEGFRIGASNGIAPCSIPPDPNQNICATPEEIQFFPDTTTNYEVGIRSQWLDKRLTVNGAIYYIDWKDPQLASATQTGAQPITKNGEGAESQGIEVSVSAQVSPRVDVAVSYSHTTAELSADAERLVRVFEPPGFGPLRPGVYTDALSGDRLPGSPQDQGAFSINYSVPLQSDWALDVNYGFSAIGDVITKVGNRVGGVTLGGYTTHYASAVATKGSWTFGLYAQNLLNKYAVTGVRSIPLFVQAVEDENGDAVRVRSYAEDVLRPRELGFRFTYALER